MVSYYQGLLDSNTIIMVSNFMKSIAIVLCRTTLFQPMSAPRSQRTFNSASNVRCVAKTDVPFIMVCGSIGNKYELI